MPTNFSLLFRLFPFNALNCVFELSPLFVVSSDQINRCMVFYCFIVLINWDSNCFCRIGQIASSLWWCLLTAADQSCQLLLIGSTQFARQVSLHCANETWSLLFAVAHKNRASLISLLSDSTLVFLSTQYQTVVDHSVFTLSSLCPVCVFSSQCILTCCAPCLVVYPLP